LSKVGAFRRSDLISKEAIMENRAPLSDSRAESDEEVIRRIDELMKDPEKFKQAIESRMDRVVKNWPKR
jgi:hypothetical protein